MGSEMPADSEKGPHGNSVVAWVSVRIPVARHGGGAAGALARDDSLRFCLLNRSETLVSNPWCFHLQLNFQNVLCVPKYFQLLFICLLNSPHQASQELGNKLLKHPCSLKDVAFLPSTSFHEDNKYFPIPIKPPLKSRADAPLITSVMVSHQESQHFSPCYNHGNIRGQMANWEGFSE